MSYTPNNWQTGDIITAQKLNNMESGIAAASSSGGTEILYFYMQYPASFFHDPNDGEETPLTVAQVTAALVDNPTAYAFLPMEVPTAPVFGAVVLGHLVLNYFVDDATSLTLYNVDCDPYDPMGGVSTPHTIAYAEAGGAVVEDPIGESID